MTEPLRRNVPCVQCGYDLRATTGPTCNECGRAVRDSLAPGRLWFADPRWLSRVARGLSLVVGGLVWGLIMFVALMSLTWNMVPQTPLAETLVWCFAIPPGLLIARGIWLATSPDPSGLDEWNNSRATARSSAMVTTVCALSTLPLLYLAEWMEAGPYQLLTLPLLVGVAVLPIFGFALLLWARSLGNRIPALWLVRQTTIVAWVYLGLMGLPVALFLGGTIFAMLPDSADKVVLVMVGIALGLFGVVSVANAGCTVLLVLLFIHRLRAVAKQIVDGGEGGGVGAR